MDTGITYSTKRWERVMVYVPEGLEPPDTLEMTGRGGELVEAFRVSDRTLFCNDEVVLDQKTGKGRKVKCGDFDCHRKVLGECGCGLHPTTNGRRLPISKYEPQ
jgi:hypothetical protein